METKNLTLFILIAMAGSTERAVKIPERSVKLAEFMGIMMGDGGMSRYQATVTLHHTDDLDYSRFVAQEIEHLFGYAPSVRRRESESVLVLVMSRVGLVRYLHVLGLPVGDKIRQGLDIPDWIKEKESFSIACVRGLVDTDGCVFTHRYQVKGKWYAYKKLSFTTASKPLLFSVASILQRLGMHPRIGRGKDVRLDRISDMERYFALVGTHNPKHLRRYTS